MAKNNSCNYPNRITDSNGIQWKLSRVIDATEKDIHHIMGKCNKAKYNVGIDENKVKISRREHIALNNFFKDKQNPREQLIKIFELVKPILSNEVKEELIRVLYEMSDEEFYIKELLKDGKNKRRKRKKNLQGGITDWKL